MDFQGSWAIITPIVVLYEMLYVRKYISLVHWDKDKERGYQGLDVVKDTTEVVEKIRKCILTAHSRQNFYIDAKNRPL